MQTITVTITDEQEQLAKWHVDQINAQRAERNNAATRAEDIAQPLTIDDVIRAAIAAQFAQRRADFERWKSEQRQRALIAADPATLAEIDAKLKLAL